MGKGDRRSKRGKIFRGTFGKTRTQRTGAVSKAVAEVTKTAKAAKVAKAAKATEPEVKKEAPKKRAVKKKAE